jgi:glycosyltransferase involved in cell wall biosynthesis
VSRTVAEIKAPRVTVGIPVYQGEAYLDETLRSLRQQDFEDFEIVISDNASTDATESICRDVAATDARVRYFRSPVNRGAAWNYNRVLELARAELFKWAAADDVCEPSFLRQCVSELDAGGPDVVLAWPLTRLIDDNGCDLGSLDDADLELLQDSAAARLGQLLHHRVEWHPVFGVIRTVPLRQTPGIGAFPCADIALLAELSLHGRFRQVPEPLFLRRYHEQRSIVAGPSFAEQVAWYDPKRKVRHVLPMARAARGGAAGPRARWRGRARTVGRAPLLDAATLATHRRRDQDGGSRGATHRQVSVGARCARTPRFVSDQRAPRIAADSISTSSAVSPIPCRVSAISPL